MRNLLQTRESLAELHYPGLGSPRGDSKQADGAWSVDVIGQGGAPGVDQKHGLQRVHPGDMRMPKDQNIRCFVDVVDEIETPPRIRNRRTRQNMSKLEPQAIYHEDMFLRQPFIVAGEEIIVSAGCQDWGYLFQLVEYRRGTDISSMQDKVNTIKSLADLRRQAYDLLGDVCIRNKADQHTMGCLGSSEILWRITGSVKRGSGGRGRCSHEVVKGTHPLPLGAPRLADTAQLLLQYPEKQVAGKGHDEQ